MHNGDIHCTLCAASPYSVIGDEVSLIRNFVLLNRNLYESEVTQAIAKLSSALQKNVKISYGTLRGYRELRRLKSLMVLFVVIEN